MDYQSFEDLLATCETQGATIADLALAREVEQTGRSSEEVLVGMQRILQQMRDTVASGITSAEPSLSGLSGGDARRLMQFQQDPRCVFPSLGIRLMAYGLATLEENSRMRTIVACPTAGGSGSVPAVLVALEHEHGVTPTQSVRGLLTAGAIGELVARRMALSGAAAGCQAEVGVATGMAAGAMVEVLGGTPAQVLHASALSMQNLMGLVCDPVAGLVEVPCVVRNGLAGIQSAAAATMALAGVKSVIPMDEVVSAMAEVGRLMSPRLKESAEAGLAQTPTGRRVSERLFGRTDEKG